MGALGLFLVVCEEDNVFLLVLPGDAARQERPSKGLQVLGLIVCGTAPPSKTPQQENKKRTDAAAMQGLPGHLLATAGGDH